MKQTSNLSLIVAFLVFLGGCRKAEREKNASLNAPSVPVKVAELMSEQLPDVQEIVGSVESTRRASVEAKIAARIEEFPVHLGQTVKKGELLAKLDAKEVEARLEQAKAAREQAQIDLGRLQVLLKGEASTRAEFDTAQSRFRVAEATLREAETILGYTRVHAPFDGVVVRKLAETGDLAVPGKPLLELEDPGSLRFVAEVPNALIAYLTPGVELPIRVGENAGAIKGTLRNVAPSGNPLSRTARVELDLSGSSLRPGTFGRLLLTSGSRPALRVPASAVIHRGQLDVSFVAKDGRAEMRLVRTGREADGRVEILSGLSPGDRVVVEQAGHLQDGQSISVQ